MDTYTTDARTRTLSTTTKLALFGAALLSFIALQDAMTHGFTGSYSRASDEYGPSWIWLASNLAHGFAYVTFTLLLLVEGSRIDAGSRLRRILRWILVVSFALMAAFFLLASPVLFATNADLDHLPGWADALAVLLIGFVLQFPVGIALGIATWRVPGLELGSRTLVGIAAAGGLLALLAAVARDFAHPAYLEATVAFGVALLGVRRDGMSR